MTRKTALILTTALTVFVLAATVALAVRLGIPAVESTSTVESDSAAATDFSPTQMLPQREEVYRKRLKEANAQLQQTYEQVQQLKSQLQQLQEQNARLLQREEVYRERLQEANRLLQQGAPAVQSGSSGPADQLQAKRVEHPDDEWGDDEHEEQEEHVEERGEWDDD